MRSLRERVAAVGTGLGVFLFSSPRSARPRMLASAAENREAFARMADRLAALEGAINEQASSIDEQFRDHEGRFAALGGELWFDGPGGEPSPSRFDRLEAALSQQMMAVATQGEAQAQARQQIADLLAGFEAVAMQGEAQAQARQQIADLLAGLEALSRVYGERLNELQSNIDAVWRVHGERFSALQSGIDAMGQGAIGVQAAQLRTEIEHVRAFHESAMSRLATAEATLRALGERGIASSPAASTAADPRALGGDTRTGRAAGVAMTLHGLVRAAARRQPEAVRAIDGFAAAFASLSDEVDALRWSSGARVGTHRPAFPALDGAVGSVPRLSILSVGERGFGADGEPYASLAEAGAVAAIHRVIGDEDAPAGEPFDVLLIRDPRRACDALEDVGDSIEAALCVQCRVSFEPTLDSGDAFADVDRDLQSLGLRFVDLIRTGRGSFDGGAETATQSRLLWADAVYVRPPESAPPSPEALLRAAYLVHAVYGMYDLAACYLERRDAVAGGDTVGAYKAAMAAARPASPSEPRGR